VASPLPGRVAPLRAAGSDSALPFRLDATRTGSAAKEATIEDVGHVFDGRGVAVS
jgi:hypothetical protein